MLASASAAFFCASWSFCLETGQISLLIWIVSHFLRPHLIFFLLSADCPHRLCDADITWLKISRRLAGEILSVFVMRNRVCLFKNNLLQIIIYIFSLICCFRFCLKASRQRSSSDQMRRLAQPSVMVISERPPINPALQQNGYCRMNAGPRVVATDDADMTAMTPMLNTEYFHNSDHLDSKVHCTREFSLLSTAIFWQKRCLV